MKRKLDFTFTCCFTGHRYVAEDERPRLDAALDEAIENVIGMGVRHFISGGAIGFDTIAAKAVIEKRKKYPEITLEIVSPCKGQEDKWPKKQQDEYRSIMKKADKVTVLYDRYITGCMQARDSFMVDNADIGIAYYRGRSGGTQVTLDYARSRGLNVIMI